MNLLKKIQQGDEKAMGQLIQEELPKMYNLSLRLCRHPEDASDLCQDAFVKALRHIHQFREESQISTWLYRIVINTWKSRLRTDKRRSASGHFSLSQNDPSTPGAPPELNLQDPTPTPEQKLEKEEKHKELYQALNRLDPEDKSIIILRDVEDLSYEKLAEVLDMNIGTVKSRLSRARAHLREFHHQIKERTPQ